MPDRSRIVEIDPAWGLVKTILDMETIQSGDGRYYRERDTFTLTAATATTGTSSVGGIRGGTRTMGMQHDNGTLSMTFRVGPPTASVSADQALAAANELVRTIDEHAWRPNRYFEWRPVGASKSSFFEIRGPGTWTPRWSASRFDQIRTLSVEVGYPVAPYALDLPMRFIDPMGIESLARDWTTQFGSAPAITDYTVIPAAGDSRLINARHLYASNERVAVRFQVPTVPATAQWIGVLMRGSTSDGDVYLAGRIRANTTPQIDLVRGNVGGTQTALGTPVAITLTAGENNWLVARIEGNVVTVEYFKNVGVSTSPDLATPTATFTHTLAAGANVNDFGSDTNGVPVAPGRVGLYFEDANATSSNRPKVIGGAGDSLGGFRVEPGYFSDRISPGTVNLWGVPGDLPPKVDVELVERAALDRAWAAVSWNSLLLGSGTIGPFGLQDSSSMTPGTGSWTNPAVAGSVGGTLRRLAVTSAGGVGTITTEIHPIQATSGSVDPDLFSEQVMAAVFAHLDVPSTVVNPRVVLHVRPSTASASEIDATYALEWGPAGRVLIARTPSIVYRLGTLPFNVIDQGWFTVTLEFYWGVGSSGNIEIDWLWFAPVSRLAQGRTGIPLDSDYPKFFPAASQTKRVYHDLTTSLEVATPTMTNPVMSASHQGMSGAFIEPDITRSGTTGPVSIGSKRGLSLTFASARNVPDNPDAASTLDEPYSLMTRLRLNAWPRYRFAVHG